MPSGKYSNNSTSEQFLNFLPKARVNLLFVPTWTLDPGVVHLNHGSFGATPLEVQQRQNELRNALEANPTRFMLERYQPLLEESRTALASFLGARPRDLVLISNATEGVNAVLSSLKRRFAPGDNLVLTNHGYNACNNVARALAEEGRLEVRVVQVPFPITGPKSVVEAVCRSIDSRTRLVLIDHVTSPTALIFPIAELAQRLEPDIPVLVDGAHGPGMLELALEQLGVSFYVGNCHKWLCAPKGAGFLWARQDMHDQLRPPVISHGANQAWPGSTSKFHAHFDWVGTLDPTPRLAVAAALKLLGSTPGSWPAMRRRNRLLILQGRQRLCEVLPQEPPAPASMIAQMASLFLPPRLLDRGECLFNSTMLRLRHDYGIEVPVFSWPDPDSGVIRISAQLYNQDEDYERLAEALADLLSRA